MYNDLKQIKQWELKQEVKNRCVIIAGGDFDAAERSVITPDDYVIAADSGYAVCIEYDIMPDLIVGDFDSFKGNLPDGIETIHLPTHKDDTDLLFAARCAADKGYRSVAILGGYGSRPDQNFAMYETLLWLRKMCPDQTHALSAADFMLRCCLTTQSGSL